MSAKPLGNNNLTCDANGNHVVSFRNGNDKDIKVSCGHPCHLGNHMNVALNLIATHKIPNPPQLSSVIDINQSNLILPPTMEQFMAW
jgi:hypothetical protein